MSHASCYLCIMWCDLEFPDSVIWGGRGLFKPVRGLRSRGFMSKRERNPEVADYNLHSQRVWWCHLKGDDPFQSHSSAGSFNIFLTHAVFAEKFITTDDQSVCITGEIRLGFSQFQIPPHCVSNMSVFVPNNKLNSCQRVLFHFILRWRRTQQPRNNTVTCPGHDRKYVQKYTEWQTDCKR